jgi:DNA-directed RNA polymerase subunit A'
MSHYVRVLPGRTFRLHPAAAAPYNADFDGDEMNLHMMQNAEAKAEAKYLSKVDGQILSPRHGHAIIKPQEDHISGLYLLTHEKAAFTKLQAQNLLYLIGCDGAFPKSDLKNGGYSGKLLFSVLLPKNFEFKTTSKLKGKLVIEKGKLTKGTLDSKTITEIVEKFFLEYGEEECSVFLNKASVLSLEVISMFGLSVSIKDYTLSLQASKKMDEINKKTEREVDNLVMQYRNKTLDMCPGMSLKETLENTIMQTCSKTRETIDEIVREDLGNENSSIIMANIGSRGSLLNAVQMSAVVGQQAVRSKRPSRGYEKRALVFFKKEDLGTKARG